MPLWSDERTDILKAEWADGLSASQIACDLGGVSRNGVIGKAHRLGLSVRKGGRKRSVARKPRAVFPKAPYFPPAPKAPEPLPPDPAGIRDWEALARKENAEPTPTENIVPKAQRCTIWELTDSTCRWPIGDPGTKDFFFCGGLPETGLPYCAYHCSVAYNGVPKKPRHEFRGLK